MCYIEPKSRKWFVWQNLEQAMLPIRSIEVLKIAMFKVITPT